MERAGPKLVLLGSLALAALGPSVADAQNDAAMWSDYLPEHWIDAKAASGAPCKAIVREHECVATVVDRLEKAASETETNIYHGRDDLVVAMRLAALGSRQAAYICDRAVRSSPDLQADPSAWQRDCLLAKELQADAQPRLAAELARNSKADDADVAQQVAAARARDKAIEAQEQAAAAAIAAQDAAVEKRYQNDLRTFRESYAMRKAVGDEVCVESFGFIESDGQIDQVRGDLIQVHFQSAGTPDKITTWTDSLGINHSSTQYGSPPVDRRDWKNYRREGLCRFRTKLMVIHDCEKMSSAANAIMKGVMQNGLNLDQLVNMKSLCQLAGAFYPQR